MSNYEQQPSGRPGETIDAFERMVVADMGIEMLEYASQCRSGQLRTVDDYLQAYRGLGQRVTGDTDTAAELALDMDEQLEGLAETLTDQRQLREFFEAGVWQLGERVMTAYPNPRLREAILRETASIASGRLDGDSLHTDCRLDESRYLSGMSHACAYNLECPAKMVGFALIDPTLEAPHLDEFVEYQVDPYGMRDEVEMRMRIAGGLQLVDPSIAKRLWKRYEAEWAKLYGDGRAGRAA